MGKNKRQRRGRASAATPRPPARRSTSLVIPILVGVVITALIVGAVISLENRRPARAALPAAATAGPLPTVPIPNPSIPRLPLQELRDKLDRGEVILVDVRSKASYDKAHAKGAISFPEEEVEARLSELPRDRPLVLY